MTQAHPLQWPKGRARTKNRTSSSFKVSPSKAYEEMMDELRRFGVRDVVVSSNIPLRLDGTPYRDGLTDKLPDPGIAIYFTRKKRVVSICCDQYLRPWENVRALGLAVSAFRSMDRHGATQVLDQAFEGFSALPSPDMATDSGQAAWWIILGVDFAATREDINAAYKIRAREAGGASVELNAAKEAGLRARGA
ncbi:MAG: hypothetical protein AAFQ38_14920 [Pseudomonadota bacterium]